MAEAVREGNFVTSLLGISSIDFTSRVPVTVAANPATHALLVEGTFSLSGTSDVNLIQVGGSPITLGQTTMANSFPVTIASNQTPLTVNQGTSPWIISGTVAATQSGVWTTGRTWTLSDATDSVTVTQGTNPWIISATNLDIRDLVFATDKVDVTGSTIKISQTGTDNNIDANLQVGGTDVSGANPVPISMSSDIEIGAVEIKNGTDDTRAIVTAANALKVDGSAVIQPVSGTITITPSGTQDVNLTKVGGTVFSLGQQLAASSLPIVLTAAQLTTLTPPTTVTVNQGTSPWVVSGTVAATQSGTWNINNITGTVSLPTGAATSANQTNGTQLTQIVDAGGDSATVTGSKLDVNATQAGAWTISATQGTSPWVISGTVTAAPTGTQDVNLLQVGGVAFSLGQQLAATSLPVVLTAAQISTLTPLTTVSVTQGTSPWVVSGTVTANAGTNLNTSLLALESGGNLAAIAASASVLDDWDESDRAKVNPIVGQVGVQGGAGAVTALTQRIAIATDANDVTIDNAAGAAAVNIQDGGNSITVDGTVTPSYSVGTLNNGAETAATGTAAQVLASNANRKSMVIQNTGVANVRIGITGVTATTGVRLVPGGSVTWDMPFCPDEAIFAIREGAISSVVLAQEVTT